MREQATDSSMNCTSRGSERLTGAQSLNWKSVAKRFVCTWRAAVPVLLAEHQRCAMLGKKHLMGLSDCSIDLIMMWFVFSLLG